MAEKETIVENDNKKLKEPFIYFFHPKKISSLFFICFDLKNGIKITIFFLFLFAIINFIEGIYQMFFSFMLFSFFKSILYLISSIYLLASIIYLNYRYVEISFKIFQIIISYSCICVGLYFLLSLSYPKPEDYQVHLAMFFFELVSISFLIYLNWTIYCFKISLSDQDFELNKEKDKYTKVNYEDKDFKIFKD
jgi:hypothetical protein